MWARGPLRARRGGIGVTVIDPEVYERATAANARMDRGLMWLQVTVDILQEDRPILARKLDETVQDLEDVEATLEARVDDMEAKIEAHDGAPNEVITGP